MSRIQHQGCQLFADPDGADAMNVNTTTVNARLALSLYDRDRDGAVSQPEFLEALAEGLHACCGSACPATSDCAASLVPAVFAAGLVAGEPVTAEPLRLLSAVAFLRALARLGNPALVPGCMSHFSLAAPGHAHGGAELDAQHAHGGGWHDHYPAARRGGLSLRSMDGYVRVGLAWANASADAADPRNATAYRARGG